MTTKMTLLIAAFAMVAATAQPAHAGLFGKRGLIRGDFGNLMHRTVEKPVHKGAEIVGNAFRNQVQNQAKAPDRMNPCNINPRACNNTK